MWRIDDMIGAQKEIKLVKIILVKSYLVKSNNCFKFTCSFYQLCYNIYVE